MYKRNSKILAALLTIILVFSILPGLKVNADSGTCGTELTWELDGEGSLIISGTGSVIEYSAFRGFTSINTVSIPNTVTSIGDYAFEDCTSLTSITIPDSITTIGNGVFQGCTSLATITIPNSVTSIGNGAFMGCTSLTGITIPTSVTSIGDYAFEDCTSLTTVTMNSSLAEKCKNNDVFADCPSSLKVNYSDINFTYNSSGNGTVTGYVPGSDPTTVYLTLTPDTGYVVNTVTVTDSTGTATINPDSSGNYSFPLPSGDAIVDATFIKGGYCGDPNVNGGKDVTWIFDDTTGTLTISGTGDMFDLDTLSTDPWSAFYESYKTIVIKDGVTSIGNEAFYYCTNLTNITIPDSVTSIGNSAFDTCTSLTGITIPDSVTSIGNWAFEDCTSLTGITIPDSVQDIGDYAFYRCTGLTGVTIPNSVTSIGDYAFEDCTSLTDVTMTQRLYDSINTTNVFQGISPTFNLIPSGYCGDPNVNGGKDVTWIFDDTTGTLTISGTGDMFDIDTISTNPWSAVYKSLKTIVINDGVTSIGNVAFNQCTSLTSITIPDSVTYIGDYAFLGCTSLKNITIPDSVQDIDVYAFEECSSLTDVTMSKTLYDILVQKGTLNDVFYGITLPSIHFSYTVDYKSNGNGTITGTTTKSFGTDQIELTIQPDSNYELDKIEWSDGTNSGVLTETNGKYEMPDSEAGAVTLTATFKLDQKTVTFKNEDGTVLQSGDVDYGTTPTYTGTTPTKSEDDQYTYAFAGWSDGTKTYGPTDTLPAVTDDATYTAVFDSTVKQYTIKFVDEDGSVLQSGNFDYGTTPVYTGTTPTKAEDDNYTYAFAGWAPAVTSVTGNATYTATFTETAKTTTAPTTPAPTTPAPTTPAPVTVSKPGTYYLSSMVEKDGNIVITIKMSEDDTKTFDLLGSVTSDGVALTEGNQYTAAKGSAIITINKSFLDTLAVGNHTLTVTFTDGGSITIDYEVKAPAAAPQAAAQAVQATGEAVSAASIAGSCLILSAAGIAFTATRKRKEEA